MRVGDEALFLDEPAKDEPGKEADKADSVAAFGVLGRVFGEVDVVQRPEVPIGYFLVEAFVELGNVEGLLPGVVQPFEIGWVVLLLEGVKREVVQDLDMGAVRVGNADVFDEGNLCQHVPGLRRACASGD